MDAQFKTGDQVIYGLHGRCKVKGIESRNINGQNSLFYILEIQKSTFSRSSKAEAAIWIPVESAQMRGLRAPIGTHEADDVMNILSNREYYFSANENWSSIHPLLEKTIVNEGATGLAKVASYLQVLKFKYHILPSEIARYTEAVTKVLARELAEVWPDSTIKSAEEKIEKALKNKNLPDN